jgi:biotin transport system substrate-specific component
MIGTHTEVLPRDGAGGQVWLARLAARLLLANLVLVVCSKIAIPLPWTPVPLTLQTFGVLLIAVLFGARASSLAALLYLVEGAAGLPVFQPFGVPAAARFFGPTAGYLLAFPVAAFVSGRLVELLRSRAPKVDSARPSPLHLLTEWLTLAAALLPGEAIVLLCGWAWLASLLGAADAAKLGVMPFLAGDLIKLAAATAIARALRR